MDFARTGAPHQEQWAFSQRGRVVAQRRPAPAATASKADGRTIPPANPKCSHKRLVPMSTARNQSKKNLPHGTRLKKERVKKFFPGVLDFAVILAG
jgi:hypothetical protein